MCTSVFFFPFLSLLLTSLTSPFFIHYFTFFLHPLLIFIPVFYLFRVTFLSVPSLFSLSSTILSPFLSKFFLPHCFPSFPFNGAISLFIAFCSCLACSVQTLIFCHAVIFKTLWENSPHFLLFLTLPPLFSHLLSPLPSFIKEESCC